MARLQGESIKAKVDAVWRSVWSRNETEDEAYWWEVFDIHEDFIVVRQGRELLRVPYTFDDDGIAEFGTPQEVELELEPVTASMPVSRVTRLEAADKKEGWVWEVVVIEPGLALNDLYWLPEALAAAVDLFEGCKVSVFPEANLGHHKNALRKNWDRIVGWLEKPHLGDAGEIRAELHFAEVPEGALADKARKVLVSAWESGRDDVLGLSVDTRGKAYHGMLEDGRAVRVVASIAEVLSLDIVARPAAGGKFTKLVAAMATDPIPEDAMNPRIKRLWDHLQARRPEALEGLDQNTVTVEQLMAAMTDEEFGKLLPEPEPVAAAPAQAGVLVLDATEVRLTQMVVRDLLQASQLPDLAQKKIRKVFEGEIAEDAVIQSAIDAERDYLAELSPSQVSVPGGGGAEVGSEPIDRLQAGLDRAFGLEVEGDLASIAPIGLKALYDQITLGHDPDVTGQISDEGQQAMLQAAFTNATLPRVVANTMNRRMLRDYRAVDYRERELISVVPASNFKTIEVNKMGYFGDIPTVDPEAADYAELAAYSEEYEQYSVGQKGAKVTITRKHIINDDIGAYAKITGRLGRSARRTFAKFVYAFFTTNPNMQDGNAWFSVAHSNLGTTALAMAELTVVDSALYNQTEPDSGEKLALEPHFLLLPKALQDTAFGINQTDRVPGSANNDANRWHHKFGPNNEQIITVPFWTDANDWVVTADPADVDIIEVAFLNGQEEPEMWIADMPTVGRMFAGDELVMKIRHEYGGVPVDHRGVYKEVVV